MPRIALVVLTLTLPTVSLAQAPPPTPAPKPAPTRTQRMQASAQRNENVALQRIDNNVVKEAGIRLGIQTALIQEAPPDGVYFATEFGQSAQRPPFFAAPNRLPSWHAELFADHRNSVFNARTFFQVGPVQPSRRNSYGLRATTEAGPFGYLTAAFNQRKIRGMVNGNVLVPLASERTPLTTDPAARAIVQRLLNAYPTTLPNRPDYDMRALNTNSPQRIDELDGSLRLDRDTFAKGRLALSHTLVRSNTSAFQFVAGQNPDASIHTHRSQASWHGELTTTTVLDLGASFQRVRSLLKPEPNAVGPRVRFGFQIEELGPNSEFPINRAYNTFRYAATLATRAGDRHTLTYGGEFSRYQLNGRETNNERGYFIFSNAFGRTAVENFRLGIPAFYEVTLGDLHRGFRNSAAALHFSDRWRLTPRLQLLYGLRYSLLTTPTEVNGYNAPSYPCDCNNFSPRLTLAWQAPRAWVMRLNYNISFGDIQPVTWQQIRNNFPEARYIQLQNPSLVTPLATLASNPSAVRNSPTNLAPDLVSPYSHQYGLTLERRLAGGTALRLGYVGSRSFKLINSFIFNRAEPVPGIPLTLDTVDRRRPDPNFTEVRHIVNAGIAYYNAALISLDLPGARGLRGGISYTFSKATDEGPDYTATAANNDLSRGRSQWQYDTRYDKKGLSNFDSTHALQLYYAYDLPKPVQGSRWTGAIFNGWQLSGVAMLRTGTPLTLFIGSDAPGFGNVDGGPSDRPNIIDPSILGDTISHPDRAPLILRRDRFAYIIPGETHGSLGRNNFRKANIANLNASIGKEWRIGSHREWTAQLRGEAYNLTNTPQFDEPQRNLSSPSFGKITNTLNDGRVFQFSVRMTL
ncbi:MAG: TonB-dependent receptor [Acidobacteria bacterium]|nr:TonB-dependent receptor [Acidobacteriota bacterium]